MLELFCTIIIVVALGLLDMTLNRIRKVLEKIANQIAEK